MAEGPSISMVAALLGDPARANIVTALMGGRAMTVTELAVVAGVALPTASEHVGKLAQAGFLTIVKQGRHRYARLADPDVAELVENLMSVAQRTGARPLRTGPRDEQMQAARICYDHLAGERGVELLRGLVDRGWLTSPHAPALTTLGRAGLSDLGVDVAGVERRRRAVCRPCLDWSERVAHLGGGLGAALMSHMLSAGWAKRTGGRVITFSATGTRHFDATFGTSLGDAGQRRYAA